MRVVRRFACRCVLLCFIALMMLVDAPHAFVSQLPRLPLRHAARAQVPETSIGGTVVDAQSGAPIANAMLTLKTCGDPPPGFQRMWPFVEAGTCVAGRTTVQGRTRSDGAFTFIVEQGQYLLAAQAEGFVSQEYGQKAFPGTGLPLVVTPGARRELRFSLIRTGSVRGRVQDSEQRPMKDVPVELLRTTYNPHGDRERHIIGRAMTDERGGYQILSLEPGDYHLVTGTRPSAASGDRSEYPFGYVYYPGVADPAAATRLTLAPGAQLAGVDVSVARETYRLRGRVLGGDAKPVTGAASVEVVAFRPDTVVRHHAFPPVVTKGEGRFEIADLAAGDYLVRASASGGLESAPVRVKLGAADQPELELRLVDAANSASNIDGRWSVDGARTRPSRHALSPCEEGVRIYLTRSALRWPVVRGEGSEAQTPWLQEDGTFAFDGMAPGEYRVQLLCPGHDVYVKDARLDGVDVLGRRFSLEGGARLLDVVLSRKAGAVDVTVSSTSEPVAGSRVVLAPADRERLDLFQSGAADANGKVRFVNVAPASYDVIAWPALAERAYFDPDVLERAAPWARPVVVRESASVGVTVTLATVPVSRP